MSRRSLYTSPMLYKPTVAVIHVMGVDRDGNRVWAAGRELEVSGTLLRPVEEAIYNSVIEGAVRRYTVERRQCVEVKDAESSSRVSYNITVPTEMSEVVFSQIAVELLARSHGDILVAPEPQWALTYATDRLRDIYQLGDAEITVEELIQAVMETTVILRAGAHRFDCKVRASGSEALKSVRILRTDAN